MKRHNRAVRLEQGRKTAEEHTQQESETRAFKQVLEVSIGGSERRGQFVSQPTSQASQASQPSKHAPTVRREATTHRACKPRKRQEAGRRGGITSSTAKTAATETRNTNTHKHIAHQHKRHKHRRGCCQLRRVSGLSV